MFYDQSQSQSRACHFRPVTIRHCHFPKLAAFHSRGVECTPVLSLTGGLVGKFIGADALRGLAFVGYEGRVMRGDILRRSTDVGFIQTQDLCLTG
jgi:hypothetical protein